MHRFITCIDLAVKSQHGEMISVLLVPAWML